MRYIIKRLFPLIVTLFIVSFLAFCTFQIIGDPIASMLGTEATPEAVEALKEDLGFNRPVLVRYFEWLGNFIHGDMGTSYSYKMPVSGMVIPKLKITLILTLSAFIITVLISIPLGIFISYHEGSRFDRIFTVLNQIVMSVPPFFIGILFTCFFGLILKFFTPGLYISPEEDLPSFINYIIYPALSIALPKIAATVKMIRASVISEMQKDYIITAISRGCSSAEALSRHALKNGLIPVISSLAVSLSEMLAGCIIIEQIFSIPGIGRLLISSIGTRDFPVVLAIVVVLALWVVLVNFLADILYQYLDPRIRLN